MKDGLSNACYDARETKATHNTLQLVHYIVQCIMYTSSPLLLTCHMHIMRKMYHIHPEIHTIGVLVRSRTSSIPEQ